ncbi:hypothetical protein [Synechococcus sp. 1G10]|uniref:hypothetical protein n=1 Tax=Synechococcus sp. 1G10 TaxID=2025605 RepID=UPI000B99B941|nr:hypothetical protein [Synechococcus sp. 1G10]
MQGGVGTFPWFEYHLRPDEPCHAEFWPSVLASLLDGSSAGELIPELVRHGLQQLIELEVAAVLGADRHGRQCRRPP